MLAAHGMGGREGVLCPDCAGSSGHPEITVRPLSLALIRLILEAFYYREPSSELCLRKLFLLTILLGAVRAKQGWIRCSVAF